jgi:5'-nucleotidase/UDP-sugar diphosphatase
MDPWDPRARLPLLRAALPLLAAFVVACSAGVTPAPTPPAAPAPAAAAPAAAAPAAAPAPRPVAITILHTNDHHGHAWARQTKAGRVGGLAARAALVARIRAEVAAKGGHVLLVDGGDFNTGSFCSDELKAEPDLVAYRRMGYQASALGNHEFDPPFDVLKRQAAQAGYPFLSANVVLRDGGKPAIGDVAEWTLGGVRVAAIGLTPPDTATLSTSGKDPRLRFLDPVQTATERVPALRARARVVVGLFHLDMPDIQKLAARVPGIDVVVSGHDHLALHQPLKSGTTTIVQAGSEGKFLGRVDLEVPATGPARVVATRLYPIGADLPEDRAVAEGLAGYRQRCTGDQVVGRLATAAGRDDHVAGPGTPSPLANLVADAFRAAARADVAFTNRGGIRTGLPAGPVTRQQVHDVLPFSDTLTVFTVTGADLRKLVDELSRREPGGQGALFPAGVTIRVRAPGDFDVLRKGKPLKPRDRFTLVVSSFIGGGGDNYKAFAGFPKGKVLPVSPKAALEAYLKAHDPARPPCEARVTWDRPPGYKTPAPCTLTAPAR